MKFDMHCHTKEGSMDGKVVIEEYICALKKKGFSGMLVSEEKGSVHLRSPAGQARDLQAPALLQREDAA